MSKPLKNLKRIESILLSLNELDYLTRSQIQELHDLKGVRNANRILQGMSEYLGTFRHEKEKVYYLSQKGRDQIASFNIRKKTQNIEHFLLRNQLYIHLEKPKGWRSEAKVIGGNVSLVADATFSYKGFPAFVEVDVSQSMSENKRKIEKYRKIMELTGHKFYLIWVTAIESRKEKLRELCIGIPGAIFLLNEIK